MFEKTKMKGSRHPNAYIYAKVRRFFADTFRNLGSSTSGFHIYIYIYIHPAPMVGR